jgi:hypothetical protein
LLSLPWGTKINFVAAQIRWAALSTEGEYYERRRER